ncbi:flagellar basal body-associated FliL family protein [Treponema parvum]
MMADNDDINFEEESGASSSAPAKKGGVGALLPSLLKWVAITIGAILIIVTVVIITMKVMGANTSPVAAYPVSEEYSGRREIYDWYTSLGAIRTKTSDDTPATVTVDVVLGYKKDDKAVSTEITSRSIELVDFLRRYFTQKTVAELKPENEENLRSEIIRAVNETILTSTKIRDVRFKQLDVIEQ